jgi:hypothetical protein
MVLTFHLICQREIIVIGASAGGLEALHDDGQFEDFIQSRAGET